jgi:transposase-like protein
VSRSEEVTVEEKRAALQEKIDAGMSIEQAAEALGISRATAYRIMQGRGPGRWPKKPEPIVAPEPVVEPQAEKPEAIAPEPAPQVHPTVDTNGRPVRMPGEDELAWRRRWRLAQIEKQRAENAAINMQLGTPLGPLRTPGVREERQRRKIADQLGFDPYEGMRDLG